MDTNGINRPVFSRSEEPLGARTTTGSRRLLCYRLISRRASPLSFGERRHPRKESWATSGSHSQKIKVTAWVVLNHDDDIRSYRLYVNGDLRDEYD